MPPICAGFPLRLSTSLASGKRRFPHAVTKCLGPSQNDGDVFTAGGTSALHGRDHRDSGGTLHGHRDPLDPFCTRSRRHSFQGRGFRGRGFRGRGFGRRGSGRRIFGNAILGTRFWGNVWGDAVSGPRLRGPRRPCGAQTCTSKSRRTSLREVFRSVLSLRCPMISAQGTPNSPAAKRRGRVPGMTTERGGT